MKLTSIAATGKTGSVTVADSLFGAKINQVLLAQAVRVYQSNKRQGTSKVLNRAEVRLTKRKWYKQKGTGNARHGAQSAPLFVGGGVAHGPTGLENWSKNLSRKMKAKALISALSAQAENCVVVDTVETLKGKTKDAVTLLSPIIENVNKVLIILSERNQLAERALANLPNVVVMTAQLVNAYDIAAANKVILTSSAITVFEERLLSAPTEKKAEKKSVKSTKTEVEKKTTKSKTVSAKKTVAKKTTVKKKTAKKSE